MNPLRLLLALALVALANSPGGAQPPKDNFGDPLPEGAKARVGTTRMYRQGGGAEWSGAVLTPDGKFLLAPVTDGAIDRIDVTTGLVVGTIGEKVRGRSGREHLYLSADGKRGAGAHEHTVRAWDAETGRVLTKIERAIPYGRGAAALSADGSTLAVGARSEREEDRKLSALVWDVGAAKRRLDVEVTQDEQLFVALSPDGKTLATWGRTRPREDKDAPMTVPDTPVQFWDATNGKKFGLFVIKEVGYAAVTFTPDGKSAVLSDKDGKVLFIDPQTGR